MLGICQEEDVCLYFLKWTVRISLSGQRLFKDHRWRIADISLDLGSESKKKRNLHHHMLFGRVSRKNPPRSSKNKLQQIQVSDMTGSSNGTGFCGQIKLKKELFGSKHTRWVWCTQG